VTDNKWWWVEWLWLCRGRVLWNCGSGCRLQRLCLPLSPKLKHGFRGRLIFSPACMWIWFAKYWHNIWLSWLCFEGISTDPWQKSSVKERDFESLVQYEIPHRQKVRGYAEEKKFLCCACASEGGWVAVFLIKMKKEEKSKSHLLRTKEKESVTVWKSAVERYQFLHTFFCACAFTCSLFLLDSSCRVIARRGRPKRLESTTQK